MHRLASVHPLISEGKRQMLSLFLASPCPLCQRASPAGLCRSCTDQVRQCQIATPCDRPSTGLTTLTWGHYEGHLRQAIGRLKYDGQTEIARLLGTELGQTWRAQAQTLGQFPRPIAIVPIPLHPTKYQQRGFNQADLLAQWFCRLTHIPLHRQGLRRVRATQAQHSLNRGDRQRNLAQAFTVDPAQISSLRQVTVWLLDDIVTTGTTAQSAAQALRRSGISVGGLCAVARPRVWHPHPWEATQTPAN